MFQVQRGWWRIAGLAAALAFVLVRAERVEATAGATSKPVPSHRTSGARGRPMPDTLLALVADSRRVTLSGFHAAWKQVEPPYRPDSLTPDAARKFLDLLTGKEALSEAASRETWVWTAQESAEYDALVDHLTLQVVLDSALTHLRTRLAASGDTTRTPAGLGLAARESTAADLRVRFVPESMEKLTRAFAALPKPAPESTIFVQLKVLGMVPQVSAAELAQAVAETRDGPYTQGELIDRWKALNPVYRPRIDRRDQLEDVIKNQLFERELRRAAKRRRIAEWPPIAAELARKREFFAVSHLVAREVYAKISMDSVTLVRFYEGHVHDWDLPLRVALTRLVLPSRDGAARMAAQLADRARAESLSVQAKRSGVNYNIEVSAESDSALFARALGAGPGAVLGPDSTFGGWQVARVLAVEPGRSRTFDECRRLVGQKWYGLEGERLMQELLDRERRAVGVTVNERAIAKLTGS